MKAKKPCARKPMSLAVIVAVLIIIIFVFGFLIDFVFNQPSTSQPISSTSQPKAAMVDSLSLTYPNQTFLQTATNILKQVGYTVDYCPGEKVNPEFFRNLPTHNYGLIVLRVHSTTAGYFFTSQPYSNTEYGYEQLVERVGKASNNGSSPFYFDIKPAFVRSSMQGRFRNATIIMMGCNGLTNTDMAGAFIEKGARVYISWNQPVFADRTDLATTQLLQHLLKERQSVRDAVRKTMQDVGADPVFNSLLLHYPLEAGDYTIPNIRDDTVTNTQEIIMTQDFHPKKEKQCVR